jgi:hypothetical protein
VVEICAKTTFVVLISKKAASVILAAKNWAKKGFKNCVKDESR